MKRTILISLMILSFTGCTLSFQNIDTHGIASDLVDENQTTSPTISPNVKIPMISK